jgi:hypothetical protein
MAAPTYGRLHGRQAHPTAMGGPSISSELNTTSVLVETRLMANGDGFVSLYEYSMGGGRLGLLDEIAIRDGKFIRRER